MPTRPLLATAIASVLVMMSPDIHAEPHTPPVAPPSARAVEISGWPSIPELPDPFQFKDGSRVQNRADWARRREEIKRTLLDLEYGPLPPTPTEGVKATEESAAPSSQPASEPDAGKRAVERHVLLTTGPENRLMFHLTMTLPKGPGPFPVIIKGDLTWGGVKPEIVASVVQRGYILIEFDRTEIAADVPGRKGGIWDAYPGYNGGAISAWAWGIHRVTDYALTRNDVDPKRVIVTGHSRGGKAALLAGALDDRVARTVANGSGCGGGGCFRFQPPKTEDLASITSRFPHWFELNFHDFGSQVDRLPIDQHLAKALCAPRSLLTTDGLGDLWANPQGAQVTFVAAKEVFDFLGVGDRIGIHYRPGKHEQNAEDFAALLDFADKTLAGKPIEQSFDQLQYKDLPKLYSWTRPPGQ